MDKFSKCVNGVTPVTCLEGENAKDWKYNFEKDQKNLTENKETTNIFLILGDSYGNIFMVPYF